MKNRTAVIILFLIAVILSGCIQKVEQKALIDFTTYFPLHGGDYYLYSGLMGRCEVSSDLENIYTFTSYDSAGNVIQWQDFLKYSGTVTLRNIINHSDSVYSVHFLPSLPFGPWSILVGDTSLVEVIEIRNDSANTHTRVMVGYEVLGHESVTTPAGTFADCIKIGMIYSSPEYASTMILTGESAWWFARNIGLVKYETAHGSGVLLEAGIEGINIP